MKNYLRTSFLKIKRFGFYNYLFFLSLLIYLFTHLIKLEDFPIYFFCDEAIQAVRASELIKNSFRDESGQFLPPFFRNFFNYNLGFSVYANIPGVLFFGKKIWAVRGTTVVISFVGAIYTSLILKNIFKIDNYWASVLFLCSSSIFFLHSRTGFETAIASSLYASFLYYYLLFRTKNPKYFFLSLAFAAVSFYSYGGMWPVIGTSFLLFFLLDFFYFLKQWKVFLVGIILVFLFFFPFLNFQLKKEKLLFYHLNRYGSYLVLGNSNIDKLQNFLENYKISFSPKWLFYPNETHHPRHSLKNYGYFPLWTTPFLLIGLTYLLARLKKPEARIILTSLLISPLGGVVVNPAPTRNLPMSIPFSILFGLSFFLVDFLKNKFWSIKTILSFFTLTLFLVIFGYCLFMTGDALKNGPTWFNDYGLYGMQYGSKQLYTKINQALDKYNFAFGPTEYTNGAEIFPIFFLSEDKQKRFKFGDEFCSQEFIGKENIFFLTKGKFEVLKKCNLPMKIEIKDIIFAPDGQELFYEVELHKL